MSHDVTQKYTVFDSGEIIVNHRNILDSPVWSVHERRIKCIFLDSTKGGESADISFIP